MKMLRHDLSCLRLDEQIFTLDLHEPRTHGPLRWTVKDGARGHIELAAVAWARHSGAVKLALRERAPHMGALVIEGIQMSECACDVHRGSRDIEDAHLVRANVLCVTKSYHHDSTSQVAAARFGTAVLRFNATLRKSRSKAIFKYSTKSFFSCSVKFKC